MHLNTLNENLKYLINNFDNLLKDMLNNKSLMEWITNMIKYRIQETGQTKDGIKLRTNRSFKNRKNNNAVYSKRTEILKDLKGQRSDIVTLTYTNEFNNTWTAFATKKFLIVKANFKKGANDISDNFTWTFSKEEFYKQILDLNKSEREAFINIIKPRIKRILIDNIKKNG